MIGTSLLFSGSVAGLLTPFDSDAPTAGYSLRHLSLSYSGAVVEVRKDVTGGGTDDFTPTQITNGTLGNFLKTLGTSDHSESIFTQFESISDVSLICECNAGAVDELDAFDALYYDGVVSTWYDQFGSNDATQASASAQPKIWDASTGLVTENGKPAVKFDGSDDYFSINSINQASDFSHFITAKGSGFIYGTGTGGTDYFRYSGYIRIAINGTNLTENTNVDNLQTQTSFIRSNTDLTTIYYNSNTGVSSVLSGEFNSNSIGSYDDGTLVYNGNIQEHIIYSSDQSANREAIEDNINDYYDIY